MADARRLYQYTVGILAGRSQIGAIYKGNVFFTLHDNGWRKVICIRIKNKCS